MKNDANQHPKFKGVWIPKEIWCRDDLSVHAKILWATVHSYCDEDEDCFASNHWLAQRLGIKPQSVANLLVELKSFGLVEQTGFDGRRRHLSTLRLTPRSNAGLPSGVRQASLKEECTKVALYIPERKEENKEEKNTLAPVVANGVKHSIQKDDLFYALCDLEGAKEPFTPSFTAKIYLARKNLLAAYPEFRAVDLPMWVKRYEKKYPNWTVTAHSLVKWIPTLQKEVITKPIRMEDM